MNTSFRRLIVGSAVTVALATTCLTGVRADNASMEATGGLGQAKGAEIYTRVCQGCHMPNGQGAVGAGRYPKLAGDQALVSWQYAAIRVLNGRGAMPSFGRLPDPGEFPTPVRLTDEQIASVVNYVRGNFGNHYKPVATTEQVAALPHPVAVRSSQE